MRRKGDRAGGGEGGGKEREAEEGWLGGPEGEPIWGGGGGVEEKETWEKKERVEEIS